MTRLDAAQFIALWILLSHLPPGSVRLRPGSRAVVGDGVDSVGNSSGTGERHWHTHAQVPGSAEGPLGGEPRPIQLNGRFAVRGDQIETP